MATIRTERMTAGLPGYYQNSRVMEAIQAAQADEFDSQEEKSKDLQNQLFIQTATWGLAYWEYPLGIPVNLADSYDIRRSRVLSKWRSLSSQFSAKLIASICEAFSGGETNVIIDVATQTVKVKFIGARGIPENLDDLKEAVEKIVHAHLGVEYSFTYLTWNELDAAAITWDQIDAMGLTYDEFDVWKPV
jgi:hypothetical protein